MSYNIEVHVLETWGRKVQLTLTEEHLREFLSGPGRFWSENTPLAGQLQAAAEYYVNEGVWLRPEDRDPAFEYPNLDPGDPGSEVHAIEADWARYIPADPNSSEEA